MTIIWISLLAWSTINVFTKYKVETLSAKEILSCGFHRIPQNHCVLKTIHFWPGDKKKKKKNHSESLITLGLATYRADALLARHAPSESFIHFRVLAFLIFQMNISLWSWLFSFKSNYACVNQGRQWGFLRVLWGWCAATFMGNKRKRSGPGCSKIG